MSKVTLELDSRQIEDLADRIDARLKNRKIPSDEKIVRIVKKIRKLRYAQSR